MALQGLLQVEAARSRHLQVEHHASGGVLRLRQQEIACRGVGPYLVALRSQHAGHAGPHGLVVVDDVHKGPAHSLCPPAVAPTRAPCAGATARVEPGSRARPSSWPAGRTIRNSAPPSSRLATVSVPSCASTIERVIDRPSPVPWALVVKNESNR